MKNVIFTLVFCLCTSLSLCAVEAEPLPLKMAFEAEKAFFTNDTTVFRDYISAHQDGGMGRSNMSSLIDKQPEY